MCFHYGIFGTSCGTSDNFTFTASGPSRSHNNHPLQVFMTQSSFKFTLPNIQSMNKKFLLQIQERLLEASVSNDVLRAAGRLLRPSDYDVVYERFFQIMFIKNRICRCEERDLMNICAIPTCRTPHLNYSHVRCQYCVSKFQSPFHQSKKYLINDSGWHFCSHACLELSRRFKACLTEDPIKFQTVFRFVLVTNASIFPNVPRLQFSAN